jgi:hypothetical protein
MGCDVFITGGEHDFLAVRDHTVAIEQDRTRRAIMIQHTVFIVKYALHERLPTALLQSVIFHNIISIFLQVSRDPDSRRRDRAGYNQS